MHMKQATGTVEDTHGKEIPHDSLKRAEQSSMQGGDMFWCCIARLKVSPHLTINLEDNINSGIIDQVIGYDAPINTYQFVLKSLRLNVPPGRLDSEWWWVYRECIIPRIRPDSSDVFESIFRTEIVAVEVTLRSARTLPAYCTWCWTTSLKAGWMRGDVPPLICFEILFKWNLVLSRVVACCFCLCI